jgi:hypothetical protein
LTPQHHHSSHHLLLPPFVGRFVACFGPRRQSIWWDIDGLETWQKYTQNNNGWRQQGKRGTHKKNTTSKHPALPPKQLRKRSAKFSNVVSPSLPTNSDGKDSPPMRASSMASNSRWWSHSPSLSCASGCQNNYAEKPNGRARVMGWWMRTFAKLKIHLP